MVTVRPAEASDASALGSVHVRAWQAAYRGGLMPDEYLDKLSIEDRGAQWAQGLSRPPRRRSARLVAEATDGTVVGFIGVGPANGDPAADVGEVYALNVDPDRWGTGAGTALLSAGVAALAATGFADALLWVHPRNSRARACYEREGWVCDDETRTHDVLGVEVPEVRYRRAL